MVLNLEQKKEAVSDIENALKGATSVVVADYQGTTVSSLSILRKQARESGALIKVVRNRLFKLAVSNTDFDCLTPSCIGPMIAVFSYEDPGLGARLFKGFAKSEEKFSLKSFAYSGKLFEANEIDLLATLPNREEALTKIACVLQAPVTKLATTINAVPLKLAQALTAVKNSKAA